MHSASSIRFSAVDIDHIPYHDFCLLAANLQVAGNHDQLGNASSILGDHRGIMNGGRIALTNSDEEWAEARKAEGETLTPLRARQLPNIFGRVIWDHVELPFSRYVLVILLRTSRRQSIGLRDSWYKARSKIQQQWESKAITQKNESVVIVITTTTTNINNNSDKNNDALIKY